jgi:ankyrin repeat protein
MGTELLATEGILVNEQNIDGNSPLHLLSRCYATDSAKQTSLLKLIIEKGGDVNLGNNNGETRSYFVFFFFSFFLSLNHSTLIINIYFR